MDYSHEKVGSVASMRGFNIWRPLLLIAVALLTRTLVNSLCLLFGMSADAASSMAVLGMVIAAFVMYSRMTKPRRK